MEAFVTTLTTVKFFCRFPMSLDSMKSFSTLHRVKLQTVILIRWSFGCHDFFSPFSFQAFGQQYLYDHCKFYSIALFVSQVHAQHEPGIRTLGLYWDACRTWDTKNVRYKNFRTCSALSILEIIGAKLCFSASTNRWNHRFSTASFLTLQHKVHISFYHF